MKGKGNRISTGQKSPGSEMGRQRAWRNQASGHTCFQRAQDHRLSESVKRRDGTWIWIPATDITHIQAEIQIPKTTSGDYSIPLAQSVGLRDSMQGILVQSQIWELWRTRQVDLPKTQSVLTPFFMPFTLWRLQSQLIHFLAFSHISHGLLNSNVNGHARYACQCREPTLSSPSSALLW